MDEEEQVRVCADCNYIVNEVSCGTEACESWTVCPGCGNIEGDTKYVSADEAECM